MKHLKSIFQAAVIAGGLALGVGAAQAMPVAPTPAPATIDTVKEAGGVIHVHRRHSRWCARNPRACERRYANRRYYNRRYHRGYAYYPRNRYYGYPGYYSYYGYPGYYGYYGRPRVGFWFGF